MTTRITDKQIREFVRGFDKNPDSKAVKLRLLAGFMVKVGPMVGLSDETVQGLGADILEWADESDFAEHAKNCKDCLAGVIEISLDYAEDKFVE